jgi:hypothetical protein
LPFVDDAGDAVTRVLCAPVPFGRDGKAARPPPAKTTLGVGRDAPVRL